MKIFTDAAGRTWPLTLNLGTALAVKDADGQPVAGKMNLYEGWFALPLPEKQ